MNCKHYVYDSQLSCLHAVSIIFASNPKMKKNEKITYITK